MPGIKIAIGRRVYRLGYHWCGWVDKPWWRRWNITTWK